MGQLYFGVTLVLRGLRFQGLPGFQKRAQLPKIGILSCIGRQKVLEMEDGLGFGRQVHQNVGSENMWVNCILA